MWVREFFISAEKAMFGVDYPHFESILPYVPATLAEFLGHPAITDDIARKVLYENAARIYGFDLDLLRPHFERIGFELADVGSAAA